MPLRSGFPFQAELERSLQRGLGDDGSDFGLERDAEFKGDLLRLADQGIDLFEYRFDGWADGGERVLKTGLSGLDHVAAGDKAATVIDLLLDDDAASVLHLVTN